MIPKSLDESVFWVPRQEDRGHNIQAAIHVDIPPSTLMIIRVQCCVCYVRQERP